MRRILPDSTLPLLTEGYAWLPDRFRHTGGAPVRTHLAGRPVLALHGPGYVPWFYDERHITRTGALPGPVLDTVFGRGAVHTLDGRAHRTRKALFLDQLRDPDRVTALATAAADEFDRSAALWAERDEVVLFDEAALLLTRAVCGWAGVPLTERPGDPEDARRTARDLVAMVDGFATPGPRHWRARAARRRQEHRLAELVTWRPEASPEDSPVAAVARHRDADGSPLDPHTAAVEVLNILRPTVAVSWYVAFAAHALHRHPELRPALTKGDTAEAFAFAQEVRRFYPFTPFVAGLATGGAGLTEAAPPVPEGTMVLLDVYGQHHDPAVWPDPYTFDPGRFPGGATPPGDTLIPQGGGDPAGGHRCPGEDITLALLATLVQQLARLRYAVPEQNLRIPLRHIPTRPVSGFALRDVRPA